MRLIGHVEWTNRDKNGRPIAVVRPIVELLKEEVRFVNSDEEFPSQGQIFWLNAVDAIEDSIVSCRAEPNNASRYDYKVADPKPVFEVIDLRRIGSPHEVRDALVKGIDLPGPTSNLRAFVWCNPNLLVGPIDLKRENSVATLVHRNTHCISTFSNPVIRSITLQNSARSQRLLRIDDLPATGFVDWDEDLAVLRRALETAVKVARQLGQDVSLSKKQIDEATSAIAAQGFGSSVELDRYRLERASKLLSNTELVAKVSESISETLRDHPSIKASFDELREKVRVDVEQCVRKDLEDRLRNERAELVAVKDARAELERELEEVKRQIIAAEERLKTIEREGEKRFEEVELAIRSRLEAAVKSPASVLADLSILRPFLAAAESNKDIQVMKGRASPSINWTTNPGRSIVQRKTLRKELTLAARAVGVDPLLLTKIHCAFVANVIPVVFGAVALKGLHAYAKALCSDRIYVASISPACITFEDIDNSMRGSVSASVEVADTIDGISIICFEGANRSPIEASLLPSLQVKDVQENSASTSGLRYAATLVSGMTTVPVTQQLWSHGVALYAEPVLPKSGQITQGDVSLSSEVFSPGEEPLAAVEELLEIWPDCTELQHILCRYGAALSPFFSESDIRNILLNTLILPHIATSLDGDDQSEALKAANDADGVLARTIRQLSKRLA